MRSLTSFCISRSQSKSGQNGTSITCCRAEFNTAGQQYVAAQHTAGQTANGALAKLLTESAACVIVVVPRDMSDDTKVNRRGKP